IGLMLLLAVAGFTAVIGFEHERAFYPTVLTVIASYYVLFAAMGASRRTLIIEIVIAGGAARWPDCALAGGQLGSSICSGVGRGSACCTALRNTACPTFEPTVDF